jgi:hypothetical protein
MPATATADSEARLLALGRRLVDLPSGRLETVLSKLERSELIECQRALEHPAIRRYVIGRTYVTEPVRWVDEILDEHLWSKQEEIYRSVVENRYTAVSSCHGVGKSFSVSRLALWWIEGHPPGSAFVVTTAPTGDQVRGVLWREMNRGHVKGGLAGRMGVAQWTIGSQLVAVGRKPANTNAAAFQGIHDEYVLVIIDEADGVAEAIFDAAADTLATNEAARVVAIGNPDRASGAFFKACQPGSGWHTIFISAFDSPNFTGEPVPELLTRVLVSAQWVEERRKKWGEDDPRWSSKVLGVAPADNPSGVIPSSKLMEAIRCDVALPHRAYVLSDGGRRDYETGARIEAARRRADNADVHAHVDEDFDTREVHVEYLFDKLGPSEWGLDVGAGGDLTVCWEQRSGPTGRKVLCRRTQFRSNDPEATADHIEAWAKVVGKPSCIKIDPLGVGWGIAGALRVKSRRKDSPLHNVPVHMINVALAGKKPGTLSPGFVTLRDEVGHARGADRRQARPPGPRRRSRR